MALSSKSEEMETSNDRLSCRALLLALSEGQSHDRAMSAMAIAIVYTQVCCIAELLFISYSVYVVGAGGSMLFYILNIFD
jgi:hypothetical protein